ncbi:MAG: HicB family protein [Clostridia bacterium]|nr:HicB family protein [Clostridia bacterium]
MRQPVYLARVVRTADNWYAIDFPDLPGTHAQCRDLKDAQREAENSLCSFLLAAKQVGEDIAAPSSSLKLEPGEMAVIVTADLEAYQRQHDTRPVRKSVSLPQWMAEGAEKKGISLSKALQEALRARLA